jgi:hypothetical protein
MKLRTLFDRIAVFYALKGIMKNYGRAMEIKYHEQKKNIKLKIIAHNQHQQQQQQ